MPVRRLRMPVGMGVNILTPSGKLLKHGQSKSKVFQKPVCCSQNSYNVLRIKEMTFRGDLRRYAANDKIFKLFFLHPFLASTIYNNTIKNKFDIG